MEEEKCLICNKVFANGEKTIEFYCDKIDGSIELIINYDIYYHDGNGRHGYASIGLNEVLKAYSFENYNVLKNHLFSKYKNDDKSWEKILDDFRRKGLDPYEDESESIMGLDGSEFYTNIM